MFKQSISIDDNRQPSSARSSREERQASRSWASEYGFHHRSTGNLNHQKTLNELDLGEAKDITGQVGNGDCYLGQSVDISERLKGHRLVHKDISSIRLRPDPAAARMANPYAISCASSENSRRTPANRASLPKQK